MSNLQHLELARQGADHWNRSRTQNPRAEFDFSEIDFTSEQNRNISFAGFDFGERVNFAGAVFGDSVNFEGATFGNFAKLNAKFGNNARFQGARFGNQVDFTNATFGADANFEGGKFSHETWFVEATFGPNANFLGASFGDCSAFSRTTFGDNANFRGVAFGNECVFQGATFRGLVDFSARDLLTERRASRFSAIDFVGAKFLGPSTFSGREFQSNADFSFVIFYEPPDFRATKEKENLNWTYVRFKFGGGANLGFYKFRIPGWTTQSETTVRLRRLRGIANEIHAVDAERDLFILERQAERGILWREWWEAGWRSRVFHWWHPMSQTILMLLYRWSSNCGRSVLLPFGWLGALNLGFYHLYARIIDKPVLSVEKALSDFTFASAIPFGAAARPAFDSAVKVLFPTIQAGSVNIPWQIQAASALQAIINLVLLFLIGLALRNHFRVR